MSFIFYKKNVGTQLLTSTMNGNLSGTDYKENVTNQSVENRIDIKKKEHVNIGFCTCKRTNVMFC